MYAAEEGLETAASVQTQEEGDTDSMGQADRARQKAFGRLDTFLDENGGIKDPVKAGRPEQLCHGAMAFASWTLVCLTVLHTWTLHINGVLFT